MKTETQPEQPVPSGEEAKSEAVVAQPTTPRLVYKTVLSALVIGIITISALWMFVSRQEGRPEFEAPLTESDALTHEDMATKDLPAAPTDPAMASIALKLSLMFERIESGFETQQTHSALMKHELSVMTETIQTIMAAVADLGESNKQLGQRISGAISRLDSIARDVRARKVVKRKPAIKHKPRPAKTPPFHIDAIDVWDDVTYVAVSQSARVAFLKVGEQQSGWTVTHIDRSKGRIDFQGPAGQVYSTTVGR